MLRSSGRRLIEQANADAAFDYLSFMSLGACGAFVSGLEDEFAGNEKQITLTHILEVRCAAVESLGVLIDRDDLPSELYTETLFALADMFNDDVIQLRLIAMKAIRPVLRHTTISSEQLRSVLDVLHVRLFNITVLI